MACASLTIARAFRRTEQGLAPRNVFQAKQRFLFFFAKQRFPTVLASRAETRME
jgi:hypothetical protein